MKFRTQTYRRFNIWSGWLNVKTKYLIFQIYPIIKFIPRTLISFFLHFSNANISLLINKIKNVLG